MNAELLKKKFGQIGARLRVRAAEAVSRWLRPSDYSIDVVNTRKGETFDLLVGEDHLDVRVVDTAPEDRHLLLLVDSRTAPNRRKFLCGHDERHWFVAGVETSASTVREAKDSLKPKAVQNQEDSAGVKTKNRHRRRNKAFVRQGEWFFVPVPELQPDERLVLHNEPIRRGSDKRTLWSICTAVAVSPSTCAGSIRTAFRRTNTRPRFIMISARPGCPGGT